MTDLAPHQPDTTFECPSWSPLDGCTCQEVLGKVDHAVTVGA